MRDAAKAWTPGARVGELRLEAEIGRGGMGVVFSACDVRNGRPYAIKTLAADATERNLERFRREAEAQARVDRHPNVLRIHSAGEHARRLYLVMDLASGGDLKQRLRRESVLPVDEAARIGVGVARGLAHAHAHGVLHRDLKPGNVMFDEEGHPQIVDFGVARLLDAASSLTNTGDMVGTLLYMAPEQVDDGKRVDERSDVYSLGALLYVCLTGVPPLDGGSQVATMRAVLEDEPRAPSSLRDDLPPALEAVCMRALSKSPEDRYASAEAFAQALEEAARPQPAPRPRGSRSWGLALLLVGAGAGLVGVIGWSLSTQRDPRGGTAPVASAAPVASDEGSRPPDQQTSLWALRDGDVLTYRLEWKEQSYGGTRLEIVARLSVEVTGHGPIKILRVRCPIESLATSSAKARDYPANAPQEALALTGSEVVFVGVLDTLTGGLDSRKGPTALPGAILGLPIMQNVGGGDLDLLANVRFALSGFFREATLARLLRLLFDVDEEARGFAWRRENGGTFRAVEIPVAAPIVAELTGYSKAGEVKRSVSATLETSPSGPSALSFAQVQRIDSEGERSTLELRCTRELPTSLGEDH